MRVGVICDSDERFDFFRRLARGHSVVRIPSDNADMADKLSNLDGILVDASLMEGKPSLSSLLRSKSFLFGFHDEERPCVIYHDDAGRLKLQCGRQVAAKSRTGRGTASPRTQTLIFQHAESALE